MYADARRYCGGGSAFGGRYRLCIPGYEGLGAGVAKKVHANALALELDKAGLKVLHQKAIAVRYDSIVVSKYMTDLLVGNSILVEPEAVRAPAKPHIEQCIDFLTAPGCMCTCCANSIERALTPSE